MQTLKRKAKMTETRIRAKRRERLVARFHSQQDDQVHDLLMWHDQVLPFGALGHVLC